MGWLKTIGGALLGGIPGALIGSNLDARDAEKEALGKQQEQLDRALERSDPFWAKRSQFGDQLETLMKSPDAVMDTPYTKFLQKQGTQAIERSTAARGLLGSGQMGIELEEFGQGLASQSFQQQFQNLAQLSGASVNPQGAAGVLSQQGNVAYNQARSSSLFNSQLVGQLAGLGMSAMSMGAGGGGMFGGALGSLFGGSAGFTGASPDIAESSIIGYDNFGSPIREI